MSPQRARCANQQNEICGFWTNWTYAWKTFLISILLRFYKICNDSLAYFVTMLIIKSAKRIKINLRCQHNLLSNSSLYQWCHPRLHYLWSWEWVMRPIYCDRTWIVLKHFFSLPRQGLYPPEPEERAWFIVKSNSKKAQYSLSQKISNLKESLGCMDNLHGLTSSSDGSDDHLSRFLIFPKTVPGTQ